MARGTVNTHKVVGAIVTANIPVDKDCGGNENSPTTNNNGGSIYVGCVSGWRNYGLLHADFSSIPSNATVVSAKLMLYRFVGYASNDALYAPISIHRVTADWTETGPTWNSKPAMSSVYSYSLCGNANEWSVHDITQIAKEWVSGTYPNYGVAIMPPLTMGKEGCCYSKEHTDPALRPYIEVKYIIL